MKMRQVLMVSLLLGLSFVVGLRVGSVQTRAVSNETIAMYESILVDEAREHELNVFDWQNKYFELMEEKKSVERDALKLASNYRLLTTFAEAGRTPSDIEDVQRLASEFDRIPFGSPFGRFGYRVTSPFGNGPQKWYRPSGVHLGIDLIPIDGDGVVYATADGEITDFGFSEELGKWIEFTTETGYRLKYGHLDKIFWQDKDGNVKNIPIKKGLRLGIYGNTGTLTTGRHLHYEIMRIEQDGSVTHLDPDAILSYIGGEK